MRRTIVVACAVVLGARILHAQSSQIRIADSLLRIGAVDRAEAMYYAGSRARPRDPEARFALGKFLVARGASRIGATLIDEAMQFGYDRQAGGAALARVYADIGDYERLEKLSPSPLSNGERAQVRWLASHPSKVTSPDSTVLVAFARATADGYVGTTRIRVNGQQLVALIAPRGGCGIRIADTTVVAQKLRRFPNESANGRPIPAAADSVGFGRLSVTNVAVTVEPLRDAVQAVVCFGFLARYAPTFDAKTALMSLHVGGIGAAPGATTTLFPILDINANWSIPSAGRWAAIALPNVANMLRDHRWTFDPRRGQVEVEP